MNVFLMLQERRRPCRSSLLTLRNSFDFIRSRWVGAGLWSGDEMTVHPSETGSDGSECSLCHQVIINLIDQSGREKIIGDAFLKQVLLYNNPNLTYVSFDFHEHW